MECRVLNFSLFLLSILDAEVPFTINSVENSQSYRQQHIIGSHGGGINIQNTDHASPVRQEIFYNGT